MIRAVFSIVCSLAFVVGLSACSTTEKTSDEQAKSKDADKKIAQRNAFYERLLLRDRP